MIVIISDKGYFLEAILLYIHPWGVLLTLVFRYYQCMSSAHELVVPLSKSVKTILLSRWKRSKFGRNDLRRFSVLTDLLKTMHMIFLKKMHLFKNIRIIKDLDV